MQGVQEAAVSTEADGKFFDEPLFRQREREDPQRVPKKEFAAV